MLTATLGGLIKDYRIKKRLSQVDISLKLNWKDTSRLSKIEQGRVSKPNRQTAERIIQALDLTEKERGHFLLVGGYLPTEDEIKKGISDIKERIDAWPYPAYFQDFSFRYLYCNENLLKTLNLPSRYKKKIEQDKPNILVTAFDPEYVNEIEDLLGQDENSLTPLSVAISSMIKFDFEEYINESWYKKLIKDLMRYDEFRELWPKITTSSFKRVLVEYDYEEFTGNYNNSKQTLKFHLMTARFNRDPRFEAILYFPANKETEKIFTSK